MMISVQQIAIQVTDKLLHFTALYVLHLNIHVPYYTYVCVRLFVAGEALYSGVPL